MKQKILFTLKAWPVIAIATIALCSLTDFAARTIFGIELAEQPSIAMYRDYVIGLVKRIMFPDGLWWYFFKDLFSLVKIVALLTFIIPAIEEVIFRWILYRLPKPALSIIPAITSSILFSAAHYIEMPWPNNAFIALFFFGMAQCWLYKKTDSLWCPIMNHGLFNATNLVLICIFAP